MRLLPDTDVSRVNQTVERGSMTQSWAALMDELVDQGAQPSSVESRMENLDFATTTKTGTKIVRAATDRDTTDKENLPMFRQRLPVEGGSVDDARLLDDTAAFLSQRSSSFDLVCSYHILRCQCLPPEYNIGFAFSEELENGAYPQPNVRAVSTENKNLTRFSRV